MEVVSPTKSEVPEAYVVGTEAREAAEKEGAGRENAERGAEAQRGKTRTFALYRTDAVISEY